MAKIIDGKAIAAEIRAELKAELADLATRFPDADPPNLSVVIVGERGDSQTYVRLKRAAAKEVGIQSECVSLPEEVSQEKLRRTIASLNAETMVHGVLLQLPVPKHIDESIVLDEISESKDVDGIHPLNFGMLTAHHHQRQAMYAPCTPLGVIELLRRSGVTMAGKRAVVLGRSTIVGIPAAHLLMAENATVTICHSKTGDITPFVREADILVCAAGKPGIVRGDMIKPGAAVIDVSTVPVPDATKKTGFRLTGDCNFNEVKEVAGYLSPVPGGVGPMTIAMLLKNTVSGYRRSLIRSGLRL
jgi:5,10-methylene-tetrahydrofolate dehydrogenase/methenyl tetrahydrofolate cyclohydrolase